MDRFERLPSELKMAVASYCDGQTLAALSAVSRNTRAAVSPMLFAKIYLKGSHTDLRTTTRNFISLLENGQMNALCISRISIALTAMPWKMSDGYGGRLATPRRRIKYQLPARILRIIEMAERLEILHLDLFKLPRRHVAHLRTVLKTTAPWRIRHLTLAASNNLLPLLVNKCHRDTLVSLQFDSNVERLEMLGRMNLRAFGVLTRLSVTSARRAPVVFDIDDLAGMLTKECPRLEWMVFRRAHSYYDGPPYLSPESNTQIKTVHSVQMLPHLKRVAVTIPSANRVPPRWSNSAYAGMLRSIALAGEHVEQTCVFECPGFFHREVVCKETGSFEVKGPIAAKQTDRDGFPRGLVY